MSIRKRLGTYSIAASHRQSVNLEHSIIRWDTLKGDVGVPTHAGEAARVAELMRQAATFLLLLAADDSDLITQFATFFCEGMHVKSG